MLPSPHVRPSQVFHESASSVWSPPKLPCEGVRAAICVHHGSSHCNNLPVFLIWTYLQIYPWFPQKFCLLFFISFKASFVSYSFGLFVLSPGIFTSWVHLGIPRLFLNFFFFYIYLSVFLAFNLVWLEIVLFPFKDLTSAATWWHFGSGGLWVDSTYHPQRPAAIPAEAQTLQASSSNSFIRSLWNPGCNGPCFLYQ